MSEYPCSISNFSFVMMTSGVGGLSSVSITGDTSDGLVVRSGGAVDLCWLCGRLGVVIGGGKYAFTLVEVGGFLDNIVEVFDGEGDLFLYGDFVSFLLLLPFWFLFPFKLLKLSTLINKSQITDVSDTWLILMYSFTGVMYETILSITGLTVRLLYVNSGQMIDAIPLMVLFLNSCVSIHFSHMEYHFDYLDLRGWHIPLQLSCLLNVERVPVHFILWSC